MCYLIFLFFIYFVRVKYHPLANIHVHTPPFSGFYKERHISRVCVLIFIIYLLLSFSVFFSLSKIILNSMLLMDFPRVWLGKSLKNAQKIKKCFNKLKKACSPCSTAVEIKGSKTSMVNNVLELSLPYLFLKFLEVLLPPLTSVKISSQIL